MKGMSTHGVTAAMQMSAKLPIPSDDSASLASHCFPVSGFHCGTNSQIANALTLTHFQRQRKSQRECLKSGALPCNCFLIKHWSSPSDNLGFRVKRCMFLIDCDSHDAFIFQHGLVIPHQRDC